MLPITRVLILSRFILNVSRLHHESVFQGYDRRRCGQFVQAEELVVSIFVASVVLFYVFLGTESIIWLILVHCYLSFFRMCGLTYIISLMLKMFVI